MEVPLEGAQKKVVTLNGEFYGKIIIIATGAHARPIGCLREQEFVGKGYIPTDTEMRTNIDGVFVAGDIRVKSLRQVVIAVADGAIATTRAEQYIEKA